MTMSPDGSPGRSACAPRAQAQALAYRQREGGAGSIARPVSAQPAEVRLASADGGLNSLVPRVARRPGAC